MSSTRPSYPSRPRHGQQPRDLGGAQVAGGEHGVCFGDEREDLFDGFGYRPVDRGDGVGDVGQAIARAAQPGQSRGLLSVGVGGWHPDHACPHGERSPDGRRVESADMLVEGQAPVDPHAEPLAGRVCTARGRVVVPLEHAAGEAGLLIPAENLDVVAGPIHDIGAAPQRRYRRGSTTAPITEPGPRPGRWRWHCWSGPAILRRRPGWPARAASAATRRCR